MANEPIKTNYRGLLDALFDGGVEHIIVGGIAANAHGSVRPTADVDVVYGRDDANLERLAAAVRPLNPYLRGAPPGLPFEFDAATLRAGLNFTLSTDDGPLDLLGEMSGGGRYQDLLPHTVTAVIFGRERRMVSLDALIRAKRAAGRPKDLEVIAELELAAGDPHGES